MTMDEASIILALEELRKWERRHARLKFKLAEMTPAQRQERRSELKRTQQQVIYYQNLLQEIKKKLNPPRAMNGLMGGGH